MRQELKDGEKKWSESEKMFSKKTVQMTTDIWKLKAEVEKQHHETEQLKTELAKNERGMTELQTQLGMIKMEDQVQLSNY